MTYKVRQNPSATDVPEVGVNNDSLIGFSSRQDQISVKRRSMFENTGKSTVQKRGQFVEKMPEVLSFGLLFFQYS
jgi:hypothetical protein